MNIDLQKSVQVLIVGCRSIKRKEIIGADIMDGQVFRISKVGVWAFGPPCPYVPPPLHRLKGSGTYKRVGRPSFVISMTAASAIRRGGISSRGAEN